MKNTPKSNGIVIMETGPAKPFKARSPKHAIAVAKKILDVRSLTDKVRTKLGLRSINFGGRIIFPVKHKRTMDKRKDRQVNRGRPSCSGIKRLIDVGRRRHTGHQIAA